MIICLKSNIHGGGEDIHGDGHFAKSVGGRIRLPTYDQLL
jgi:hypothetical protein